MADTTAHDTSRSVKAGFLPVAKQKVLGLAEDFWVDGPENLLKFNLKSWLHLPGAEKKNHYVVPESERLGGTAHPRPRADAPPFNPKGIANNWQWHALPGEVSEKMWGEGQVMPGGDVLHAMLIRPLGLSKENSVLDLSAGLGGMVRKTAEETGAYMTGMEPDPGIAKRGMELSIKAGKAKHAPIDNYDPLKLVLNRTYDCILARECFYRAPDQAAFFAAIAKHSKPQAHLAFTDYIIDVVARDNPTVQAWQASEKAHPLTKEEMFKMWAEAGFNIRVYEDLTELYKNEIKGGMTRLLTFLASSQKPDKETLMTILKRIETWKMRSDAMSAGLKFGRFYGTKK